MNLPVFFKPILWSYDFSRIDSELQKKTIVVNTINYGDLRHWRWIAHYYGRDVIAKVLAEISASEIRPRAQKLAGILFSITSFNHASRGAHRTG